MGERNDARRLTDGTHGRHDRRGDADDGRSSARDPIDNRISQRVDERVAQRDRVDRDAAHQRLVNEVFAVEQDQIARSAPPRDLAEARDDRIGPAGDTAHVYGSAPL